MFVAGGGGGQRSAVAAHVAELYDGWVALSVEKLMRDEIASGSSLGQEINDLIGEDRPVPTDVQVRMLDRAMDASPHDKFIVHDFPTSVDEALAFENVVGGPRFFLDLSGGDGGDGGERTKEVLAFYASQGYVRQVSLSVVAWVVECLCVGGRRGACVGVRRSVSVHPSIHRPAPSFI